MRRGRLGVGIAAICVAGSLALVGCDVTTGPGYTTTPVEATATAVPPRPPPNMIVVPDVLGTYFDEGAAVLKAAGLEAVDVPIYGPTDEDAGEIGKTYRQTPSAGSLAEPGTKVELRSWYESQ